MPIIPKKFNVYLIIFILLFFPLKSFSCYNPKQKAIVDELIRAGARLSQLVVTDYGRVHHSANCYVEAWPRDTKEVATLVKIAYDNNIPIRTQGAAHSENGASLPHAFELLIHTNKLNQLKFDHIGRVSVGAGIPIALVKVLVSRFSSFLLPVANDGDIAPSVGGYISAGGISSTSINYGGFWEHVYEITLVASEGKILSINRNDPIFLYLFGAMGQLGIITEAKLNLLPNKNRNYYYPLHQEAAIDYPSSEGKTWIKKDAPKALHWFNLFVPLTRVKEAERDLNALQNKYPHALNYNPIYKWQVTYISQMPPLVFNQHESFVAIGTWGEEATEKESAQQFKLLQEDFSELVTHNHYKRYIQVELAGSKDLYQNYFDKETLTQFKKIKRTLDPKFLFNQGSFFSSI